MIRDINELEEHALIEADLCIIGGGAAAITMARELSSTGISVCILESGGYGLERETQRLYAGDTSGVPYFSLTDSRCRLFGGSTYRWGARGAPMLPSDFAPRPWVPASGWPLSSEELGPYYSRAYDVNGMHVPFSYDRGIWENFDIEAPDFDEELLYFQAFQFGKIILFGDYYRNTLKDSRNIDVYLYANVTGIQSNEQGNRIEHVDIATLQGRHCKAVAKYYVLACGGIENPRLLLSSDSVCKNGLCNDKDLVGRYFMEHPTVPIGTVETNHKQTVIDYYSPGRIEGRLVEIGLALSSQVQEADNCLHAVSRIKPALAPDATQALREVIWDLMHRRITPGYGSRLGQVLRDPLGVVRNVYRHMMNKPKRYNIRSLFVEVRTEQAPNPDSRVTLADRTDALGMRQPHLHWDLNELDKHTMQVAARVFGQELERVGHGKFRPDAWLEGGSLAFPSEMVGGHHHMGTTRMSDDPNKGIVDINCRTHAVDNLYIAGSSVFPTVGYVNPTLTIIALSIRLADHLKESVH